MSYAAKHYVKISGRRYTPGEIIDIPIPEEKLLRLLRLKAIARQPDVLADPDDGKGEDDTGDARQTEGGQPEGVSSIPSEGSAGEEPEDEEDDDEDEEAKAPEIDVMDGIVSAGAEDEAKPEQKKGQRKTAGKGRTRA